MLSKLECAVVTKRDSIETPFAVFTLLSALLHFGGETWFHVTFGQPTSAYVVDLISIALMLLGATSSLLHRNVSSAGWLAAAWGFALCLNYRAYFSRVYRIEEHGVDAISGGDALMTILGGSLLIAAFAFPIALWLARPRA